jgi:D-alanyl-D-alanine carboxypeptidase (penicillin-binding protein 5/6)
MISKSNNNFFILLYTICLLFFHQNESFAITKKKLKIPIHRLAQASLVVDANTGEVLHQLNADKQLHPASLTKLMTCYIAFEAVRRGKLTFKTQLPISKFAASRPRTKLGLKAGNTITVKEAVLSLIVKSANDSAVVLGEAIGKTESNFARIMNKRAKELGMHNTNFVNASGWHHPQQKTTAKDMAKMAIALKRDFPEFYPLFSRTSFYYKSTRHKGHNYVTESLHGAEGMKTGYTAKSGWNLVTTAKRGSKSLVGVVLGEHNAKVRDSKMINLINHHFKGVQVLTKDGFDNDNNIKEIATKITSKNKKNILKVSAQPSLKKKQVPGLGSAA